MIFRIDKSIQDQPDSELLIFAKAVLKALDNLHFVEMDYGMMTWFEEKILGSDNYLGKLDREALMVPYQSATGELRKNLSTIVVGYSTGMKNATEMFGLAEKPATVILENGLYDWEVVRKWIKLYRKNCGIDGVGGHLHRIVGRYLIKQENGGGGNGSISNVVKSVAPSYEGQSTLKVTTLFDSDKNKKDDEAKNSALTNFLNQEGYDYHELEKREIENYFPISTYEKAGLLIPGADTQNITEEEWDYMDIGKSGLVKMEKKDVLSLSEYLTKPELQQRVRNTVQNGRDEIQRVILFLAKYI